MLMLPCFHAASWSIDRHVLPRAHAQMATVMHSGEGEMVTFAQECVCDGPVESWLQNVVDSMRLALMEEFRTVGGSGMLCMWVRACERECACLHAKLAHTHTATLMNPACPHSLNMQHRTERLWYRPNALCNVRLSHYVTIKMMIK